MPDFVGTHVAGLRQLIHHLLSNSASARLAIEVIPKLRVLRVLRALPSNTSSQSPDILCLTTRSCRRTKTGRPSSAFFQCSVVLIRRFPAGSEWQAIIQAKWQLSAPSFPLRCIHCGDGQVLLGHTHVEVWILKVEIQASCL